MGVCPWATMCEAPMRSHSRIKIDLYINAEPLMEELLYPLETYDAFKRQRLTMDEPKSPDLSGLVGDSLSF